MYTCHPIRTSRRKSDAAAVTFKDCDRLMIQEGYTGAQITKITTQSRTTHQRWLAKNEEVLCYEEMHNIEVRWAPTMQEYEDGLVLVRECKYHRALDDLERLVVQRLFEMTKLGMNGVGMSKGFFFSRELDINICCQVTSFARRTASRSKHELTPFSQP